MRTITIERRGQHFVFRYQPGRECELLEAVADLAADPASAFDWSDAAAVSFQVTFEQANDCLKAIAPDLGNQAA